MDSLYEAFAGWARAGILPAVFVHPFMVRGLMGALLLGPLFGGIGTIVVARRLSFFVQAIGNAAMTGTALGLLLGEPPGATWAGIYGFCLVSALVVTFVKHRGRIPSDTVTGIFLAQTLGLGVLMVSLVGALLVLVMIVVPAAAAQNAARNLRQFFFASIALSTLAAVGGLLVSGYLPVPTGGAIALVSTALFYLTLALSSKRREASR